MEKIKKVGGRNVGPHGSTTRSKTVFCSPSRWVEGNLNFFWRYFLRTRKSHIRSEKYGRVFEKGGGNKAVCWEKGGSGVRKWKHTSPAFPFSGFIFRSSGVFPVLYAFFQGRIIPLFLWYPFFSGGKNIFGSFSFPVRNRPKKLLICHERAIPRRIMRERVCSVFILQVVTPPPRPKIHTIRHYPFPLVYCTGTKKGGAVSGFLPFPLLFGQCPSFPSCCIFLLHLSVLFEQK